MIDRQSEIFIPDLLFKVSFFKRIDLWQFLAMHVKSFKVFHCSVIKVLMECIPVISYASPVVRSRATAFIL